MTTRASTVVTFPAPSTPKPSTKRPLGLTADRIAKAAPKAKRYRLSDVRVPGLNLHVEPSGARLFYLRTSIGRGEGRRQISLKLGDASAMPLDEARRAALHALAEIRAGRDPRPSALEASQPLTLAQALERYATARADLVRLDDMLSSIRRDLAPHLDRPLVDLTRAGIVSAIERCEGRGRPGAGAWLRKSTSSLLSWAEGAGLVERNVLSGLRRPAATRGERLRRRRWTPVGTEALAETWRACSAASDPSFATFCRLLLLLGLRRGELASARWSDLDLEVGTLTIPAERRKTGQPHVAYLGPISLDLLGSLPLEGERLFPSRTGGEISGWTQRVRPIAQILNGFELHGLRRGYRSALGALGVEHEVAELMVGHARAGLAALYDHDQREGPRREAQHLWEEHLKALVHG